MRSNAKLGTVVSTTDLLNYLSCEELNTLDLLRAKGRAAPVPVDDALPLAVKMGLLSEAEVLESLEKRFGPAARIGGRDREAFDQTQQAMIGGANLIYQGLLFSEVEGVLYEGRPDFLIKVDRPSALGGHSYEPADSKLSKTTKLEDLVQVLDYADLLAIQQGLLPRRVHLFLAGGEQASYRTDAYIEEVRLQKRKFLQHVERSEAVEADAGLFANLDPKPNSRCTLCDWRLSCEEYWEKSHSLFRVANITRSQVAKLNQAGIKSMTDLIGAQSRGIEAGIARDALETLRAQAAAQLKTMASASDVPYFEVRQDAHALALAQRGLGLLPRPSEGDIFFDIEGDPFYKPDGLEYLFGIVFSEDGSTRFKAFWGTDPEGEKRAFGELVEFIIARWLRYPDLHVYHYADYERSALSRLASRSNFKVFEVDTILRNDLLVDLYPVVKGTLILGADSYSLKKVEKLYLTEARKEAVTTAMGSVESFEAWLEGGSDGILEEIERYNEMDVRSTAQLRDFLMSLRGRVAQGSGEFPFRGEDSGPSSEIVKGDDEVEIESYEMALDTKAESEEALVDRKALELCSDLIGFYRREGKPTWWRYFNLISPERDGQDFLAESGCIGGLEKESERLDDKGNRCVTYRFDRQQAFKFGEDQLLDPELEREIYLDPDRKGRMPVGKVSDIDFASGLIEIRMDKKYPKERDPRNLIAFSFVGTDLIEAAMKRFAEGLLEAEELSDLSDVGVELLAANRPRFLYRGRTCKGISQLAAVGGMEAAELEALAMLACETLDSSYLIVQGPPGAGKTFLGAKLISDLVRRGKKVFATALSHSAIDNLIEALVPMIDDPARLYRVVASKAKRRDGVSSIKAADIESRLHIDGGLVVGGTIWSGAREDLAKGFDYGFVDEAGQFSLASTIALSTSCENIVLTGDPQQLSQPLIGSHPTGAANSVLEHLVGDREVVDPDYGLFLPKTFRMHPRLAEVVSAISYDSKLSSSAGLERLQLVNASPFPASGLAYVPVKHEGNTYRSLEEVQVVERVCRFLLERSWIDKFGVDRPVTPEQVLVVTPYNAQVNALKLALSGMADVGTVDKFQGREAAFVILSLAASDGESSGRGVDFLFSTNRLNVAISRAKVMSVIVASPELIETKPRTLEQLLLLGAVTKAIESSAVVDTKQIP